MKAFPPDKRRAGVGRVQSAFETGAAQATSSNSPITRFGAD